ncbi:hypothetical protein GCM10009528_01580 [Kineococcus aurantiacus]
MIGSLQLTATYIDGLLVLRIPSTGATYSTLPLDDLDPVEALQLLEAGHDVGRWPFASLTDLDGVLNREGWNRVMPWSGKGDGASTTVEEA